MKIEPTFSIFYINCFRIVSLHNYSRLSDFKNQLPALVSRGVADTAYQRYRSCQLPAIMLMEVADSPHNLLRRVGLLNFLKRKLSIRVIQRVVDSPHRWYSESLTPRIGDRRSWQLPASVLRRLSTPSVSVIWGSRPLRISVILGVNDSMYRR